MAQIAIVDDDRQLQELFAVVLRERGWEVAAYTTFHDALERLQDGPPDLIILDIWFQSPDTGWKLLQNLKMDVNLRDVPIVICTGATDLIRDKEAWLLERDIPVLLKPFEIDDLYVVIDTALERRHPNPSPARVR